MKSPPILLEILNLFNNVSEFETTKYACHDILSGGKLSETVCENIKHK